MKQHLSASQTTKKALNKFAFYFILIGAITIIALLWIMNIIKPCQTGLVGDVDFPAYYSASYIVRFMDAHKVYNLELQYQIQENLLNSRNIPFNRLYPYNHPPVYIGLLYTIGNLDYNAAYIHWLFYLIIFHLITLWLLIDLSKKQGYSSRVQWGIGISGLFFFPIHLSYSQGQDSALLLLSIVLWFYGLQRHRSGLTMLGLTLAMIRPQIGLALLIPTLAYTGKPSAPYFYGALFSLPLIFPGLAGKAYAIFSACYV